jgi:hypothetical protein
MRAKAVILFACAATLALSACNRHQEDAAALSSEPAASVQAPKPKGPELKAGLWEISASTQGEDSVVTNQVCVDGSNSADFALWDVNARKGECSQRQMIRQADGSWSFASTCDMGSGGKVITSGSVSGDFSRDYTVRLENATQGAEAAHMNRIDHVTIKARWTGACKPGQKGGDLTVPGA